VSQNLSELVAVPEFAAGQVVVYESKQYPSPRAPDV
jgi:hypothetical protein